MKKLLCFLLAFLSCTVAEAQQDELTVGITGGPNYTLMRGGIRNAYSYEAEMHYSAGFSFQYHLPKVISFVGEAVYEIKGTGKNLIATDSRGVVTGKGRQSIQYNYLVMPLLVRATFGNKFRFFANAGAFGAYLTRSHQVFSLGTYAFDQNTTAFFRHYDWGAVVGAGVAIPLKRSFSVSAECRYNHGLYNLQVMNSDPSIKTSSFNLLCTVAYRLMKRK